MAAFLWAASANAGTVAVSGTTFSYNAAPGEANELTVEVRFFPRRWIVTDTGAPVTAGPGCAPVEADKATCPVPSGHGFDFAVVLGDMDDAGSIAAACGDNDVVAVRCDDGTVEGGDGNDTLIGAGAPGVDLHGDAGDDDLRNGASLDGGPGADTLRGGYAFYGDRVAPVSVSLNGLRDDGETGENDLVGERILIIATGAGDDVIVGDDRPNIILAGGGADIVHGGAGADSLYGCLGPGDAGADGNDELKGEDDRDILDGCAGDDSLDGGAGTDFLTGGPGADDLLGAAGSADVVRYSERTASVSVSLNGLPDDGEAGEGDLVQGVEDIETGSGDDLVAADAGDNRIWVGLGDDIVTAGGGDDLVLADFRGCHGRLAGAGGDDELYGEGGADVLDGCAGDDLVDGGVGNDTLMGDRGADTLLGGAGTDEVSYSARGPRADVFVSLNSQRDDGEAGENDLVDGVEDVSTGAGDDAIVGDSGRNVILAGGGADVVRARGGDDFVQRGLPTAPGAYGPCSSSSDEDDRIYGGYGDDVLHGCRGSDLVHGGPDRDTIIGGPGDDRIRGGAGGDRLKGWAGDDLFNARDGVADRVWGGRGFDRARIDPRRDRTSSIERLV
jgi:Ca2+-binding RTX toxin-like protein